MRMSRSEKYRGGSKTEGMIPVTQEGGKQATNCTKKHKERR